MRNSSPARSPGYGRVDLLYLDELVPGWLVRTFHAALKAPLLALGARGRRAR